MRLLMSRCACSSRYSVVLYRTRSSRFPIVCSRLVDEFGGHRTHELEDIFRTSTPEGRDVLRQSLRYMNRWVGGLAGYESRFPVTIKPARPAFPLFKIVGIDRIAPTLFRVLIRTHSPQSKRAGRAIHRPNGAPARRTKASAPCAAVKALVSLVFLQCVGKPFSHAEALQILPEWESDCSLRASIPSSYVSRSTFLAFNGDIRPEEDAYKKRSKRRDALKFVKYFYEPMAQDHEPLPGGGLQIGVAGAPRVSVLEEWSEQQHKWNIVWRA